MSAFACLSLTDERDPTKLAKFQSKRGQKKLQRAELERERQVQEREELERRQQQQQLLLCQQSHSHSSCDLTSRSASTYFDDDCTDASNTSDTATVASLGSGRAYAFYQELLAACQNNLSAGKTSKRFAATNNPHPANRLQDPFPPLIASPDSQCRTFDYASHFTQEAGSSFSRVASMPAASQRHSDAQFLSPPSKLIQKPPAPPQPCLNDADAFPQLPSRTTPHIPQPINQDLLATLRYAGLMTSSACKEESVHYHSCHSNDCLYHQLAYDIQQTWQGETDSLEDFPALVSSPCVLDSSPPKTPAGRYADVASDYSVRATTKQGKKKKKSGTQKQPSLNSGNSTGTSGHLAQQRFPTQGSSQPALREEPREEFPALPCMVPEAATEPEWHLAPKRSATKAGARNTSSRTPGGIRVLNRGSPRNAHDELRLTDAEACQVLLQYELMLDGFVMPDNNECELEQANKEFVRNWMCENGDEANREGKGVSQEVMVEMMHKLALKHAKANGKDPNSKQGADYTSVTSAKDWINQIAALKQSGWDLVPGCGKHFKYKRRLPDGSEQTITAACTPSDGFRGIKNFQASLKRLDEQAREATKQWELRAAGSS